MKLGDLFIKLGLQKGEFDKGIDDAKKGINDLGSVAASSGSKLSGIFGASFDVIKEKVSSTLSWIGKFSNAFSFAASGGQSVINLASAQSALTSATATATMANEALTVAQTTAGISAEALALAEAEAATASVALTEAQSALTVAQTAATAATTLGSRALAVFKVAMISTGIGALIVGLGSLVAYFTQTAQGAKFVKIVMAEIGAVTKVLTDRFSSFGEGLFKLFSGDFKGAAEAFKSSFKEVGTEIVKEAKAAGDLKRETLALNKAEREAIVLQQERLTKASQLRAAAREEGITGSEKVAMLDEAKKYLLEYYAEEKKIATGRRDILIKEAALHKNMGGELTAVEEAKKRVVQIDGEQADTIRSLSREYRMARSLQKANQDTHKFSKGSIGYLEEEIKLLGEKIEKTTNPQILGALQKELRIKEDILKQEKEGLKFIETKKLSNKDISEMLTKNMGDKKPIDQSKLVISAKMQNSMIDSDVAADVYDDQIKKAEAFVDELNQIISSGIMSAIESMATGLTELALGDIGGKEFGLEVLQMVGKFMITLGTAIVTYSELFKKFIENISNPWVTAGLGIGLIVAGAAISSIASHGLKGASGGANTSSAASGYSNYSASNASAALSGNVVFELEGTKLRGALNNTDRRNTLIR